MSELAKKLIAENIAKHERGEDASYLDLGCCGLTELPDLSGMDWVETLILSDEWSELDDQNKEWIRVKSRNVGSQNHIEKILPSHINLPHLKRLFAGSSLDVIDWQFLRNLTGLVILDLDNNSINDGFSLKGLTNLRAY